MFFATPEVIETLNAYYVPISVDVFLPPGSVQWHHRLKEEIVPKYPFAKGPSAWIISPEGRPIRIIDVKVMQHRPQEAMQVLKSVVEEMKLTAGPTLHQHVPDEFKKMKEGDVALHVTSRFLLDTELNGLDPRVPVSLDLPPVPERPAPIIPTRELFNIRLVSPIDEWCVVPADTRDQLLPPPGLGKGGTYPLGAATASTIYRHFCPPTFNAHLSGKVLASTMTGKVVRVGDETVVQLEGSFASEHQLWGGPDSNIAEGYVVGYLAFDTKTRGITRFGMTTDPGVYGDRKGFRVPFVATATLWKGGYDGSDSRSQPVSRL